MVDNSVTAKRENERNLDLVDVLTGSVANLSTFFLARICTQIVVLDWVARSNLSKHCLPIQLIGWLKMSSRARIENQNRADTIIV